MQKCTIYLAENISSYYMSILQHIVYQIKMQYVFRVANQSNISWIKDFNYEIYSYGRDRITDTANLFVNKGLLLNELAHLAICPKILLGLEASDPSDYLLYYKDSDSMDIMRINQLLMLCDSAGIKSFNLHNYSPSNRKSFWASIEGGYNEDSAERHF